MFKPQNKYITKLSSLKEIKSIQFLISVMTFIWQQLLDGLGKSVLLFDIGSWIL